MEACWTYLWYMHAYIHQSWSCFHAFVSYHRTYIQYNITQALCLSPLAPLTCTYTYTCTYTCTFTYTYTYACTYTNTYTLRRVGDLLEAGGRPRDAIPVAEVEALVKNAYSLQARSTDRIDRDMQWVGIELVGCACVYMWGECDHPTSSRQHPQYYTPGGAHTSPGRGAECGSRPGRRARGQSASLLLLLLWLRWCVIVV